MATLELNNLTEAERDLILSVVRRDEELQIKEQARVEKLKSEIKLLKMKGALKPGMNAEKSCARCRKAFGWLFDKGENCLKCEQKVCEQCRFQKKDPNKWLCTLCLKQKELDAMSGAWFYSKFGKSKRSKKTNKCITGTDIVRSSFKKRSHAEMSDGSAYEGKQSMGLSSRRHGSSPEADGESSDTQSMEAQSPRHMKKSPDYTAAAFPKDAERIMLLDLMGRPLPADSEQPIILQQPALQVQHLHPHGFSDSSSSEGPSAPSSPQLSHRSEYPASESINSSFRSTSAMSSDGQYTMVTDNNSIISGISTAPPSMQQSPRLSGRGRTYSGRQLHGDEPVSDLVLARRLAAHNTSGDSFQEAAGSVQTVKVSSRGRAVSSSSSEGEELLARSLQEGHIRQVVGAGAVVHAAHSSGSDSSRTVQPTHAHDLQSQHSGSVSSGADTGSTLEAPVLAPPHEFLGPGDMELSSRAPTGGQQPASVSQRVHALLANYNVPSPNSAGGHQSLVDHSNDQPVHRLSPDDYHVIDTPPLQKKARFVDNNNYKFTSDDDPDASQSSFEELPDGHSNIEKEEMDWDSEDFDAIADLNLQITKGTKGPSLRSENERSSLEESTQQKYVNGNVIEGIERRVAKDYVIVSGYESDEYSDSLSVITERTEPDDTEQESEDSDHTLSAASDSDIDLEEMFHRNKNILDMHESEAHFIPIASSVQQVVKNQPFMNTDKSSNSSKEPEKVEGKKSIITESVAKRHFDVPLKAESGKHHISTDSSDKSAVSTIREGHEIKCEKYECISVSSTATKNRKVDGKVLGSKTTRSDTDLSEPVIGKLQRKSVERVDESHLKSVLQLQNLFNNKSPVHKPRVSREYSDSGAEIEDHTSDNMPADTSPELHKARSTNVNQRENPDNITPAEKMQTGNQKHGDVSKRQYHNNSQEPFHSSSRVSVVTSSLVDTALNDALKVFDTGIDSIKENHNPKLSNIYSELDENQNKEVAYQSPHSGVIPRSREENKSKPSTASGPGSSTPVSDSNVSQSKAEHFVREKSPIQTSSPVIKRKKRKSQLASQGIIHPAFASRSYIKQSNKLAAHPHMSESQTASPSDFLSSTPTSFSATPPSPSASSQGSLGLSKASSPEVDQSLVSDLSSVHDTERSSDVSSYRHTHPNSQTSFTGSVPSLTLAEAESREEDDSIDDLVDSFKKKPHARSQSNLLSPFSSSVESVASIYSEAGEGNFGKIPVTGEIQFGLDYNYQANILEIHIKQCKGIAAVDTKRKRSDPYVKTYLLPDRTKTGKKKTRVRKHTVNPVFNEIIKYHIGKSEVETRTLWVTLWHNDTFGRNDFLGEVTVALDYYEFKDRSPKWYTLQERAPVQTSLLTYKGDLNVALKYVTADNVSSRKVKGKSGNKGELLVLLKQARNLTAVRSNGTSDPFCKGYLLPEKGKAGKQKTSVIKKNCNPQWNHTFVFEDVGWEELRERTLELTIWDHDRFTSNDFLGGVRLGLGTGRSYTQEVEWSDSRGEEISVWQSMLDRPNTWIEVTLLLRPNMNSRTPHL